MTRLTQSNRAAQVKTDLPDGTLVLAAMDGTEALSRLFAWRLTLLSERADIRPDTMLGMPLSVLLDTSGEQRQFNGIVARFSIAEHACDEAQRALFRYEALVRPTLWLLTRGAHCRFFHERSVLDVVAAVLGEYGVDYENACVAEYPALEHCAQYDETDFDVVSRLQQRHGI